MNSLRVFVDRKTVSLVAVFALLLSLALPIFASAAQITTRSVELSSATKSATGVQYKVNFTIPTGDTGAGAVGLQFCSNSPLVGEDCDPPTGLNVASATVVSGADSVSVPTVVSSMGPALVAVGDTEFSTAGAKTFTLGGITNPSSAGSMYVRVITYDTAANATDDYDASDNDGIGGVGTVGASSAVISSGSIALSIVDGISVSGAVLESLTFCASAVAMTDGDDDNNYCEDATTPTVTLGHDVGGGVIALSADALDTGAVYTQLSTNASGGAVVRIKSGAICGGLIRAGDTSQVASTACTGIPASGPTGNVTSGTAGFGLRVGTAALDTNTTGSSDSTGSMVAAGDYNNTDYRFNWVANNATGVSSTYGDDLLNTSGATATEQGATLTFGTSISSATPAGRYSADLSLIATGTF